MDEMSKEQLIEVLTAFIAQSIPTRWIGSGVAEFELADNTFVVHFDDEWNISSIQQLTRTEV